MQRRPPRRPDHGRPGADRRAAARTTRRLPAPCVALAATCAGVGPGGSQAGERYHEAGVLRAAIGGFRLVGPGQGVIEGGAEAVRTGG